MRMRPSGFLAYSARRRLMNSSAVIESLFQAIAPSEVMLRVIAGSRASAVSDFGRLTLMPADLLSESVNRMKVASRKKMTSMSGMISMRAFFFPPLPRELVPPAMVGGVGLVRYDGAGHF